jgi:hypothetical protein
VAYSLDDIRWGVSATQDEITSSGLAGLSPGGVFTIEQARTLKDICCKYKAAFATGKIPHPNKRPPVQVELIPDPPDARWPSKPHHCPAPVWATNARKYLNKLRQFWLREGMIAAGVVVRRSSGRRRFAFGNCGRFPPGRPRHLGFGGLQHD